MIHKKQNKTQGEIYMTIFLLFITLIMIFILTRYHETVLVSNYNINTNKLNVNSVQDIKNEVINCYGYPVFYDENIDCNLLENINYELSYVYNGLCKNEKITGNGINYSSNVVIFLPIYKNDSNGDVCTGNLIIYFEEHDK